MPILLPDGTQVKQRQVDKSASVTDSLAVPTLSYTSQKSLEDDLNYLRSILKQVKGTIKYDSALLKSLEDLRLDMEAAVFYDADLRGNSVSVTPTAGDYSTRIATTEFVTNTVNTLLSGTPGDARFIYTPTSGTTEFLTGMDNEELGLTFYRFHIVHSLGKFPTVTAYDSSNERVIEGQVEYINTNELYLYLTSNILGKAYLN
jgi:hypothetical protein